MFTVLLFLGLSAGPSSDSLQITEKGWPCNSPEFCWLRIVLPDSAGVRALDYDPSGQLRREQHFRSRACTILEGPAVYFDDHGRVTEKGQYRAGRRAGRWSVFNPIKGTVLEESDYRGFDSVYRKGFDPQSGLPETEGWETLSSGRTGAWIRYRYRSNDTEWIQQYSRGQMHGMQFQRWPNGRPHREEFWQAGKKQSARAWDSSGRRVKYQAAYEPASPPVKHFRAYVLAHAPGLTSCLIRGNITIRVPVSAKGQAGYHVSDGLKDAPCASELQHAMDKLRKRKWKPARIEGRPVEGFFTYTLRDYAPRE